jgi:hypothetical protein
MAVINNPPTGPYALHAFVYPTRDVQRLEPYGRVSFQHIYQARPPEARYAIAGYYNVVAGGDEFLVWDLFGTMKRQDGGKVIEPLPKFRHADLDAAIMATVLTFGSPP